MKPINDKDKTYIDSSKEVKNKDSKFQVGDPVRISKCKKFLLMAILQIGLKKFL